MYHMRYIEMFLVYFWPHIFLACWCLFLYALSWSCRSPFERKRCLWRTLSLLTTMTSVSTLGEADWSTNSFLTSSCPSWTNSRSRTFEESSSTFLTTSKGTTFSASTKSSSSPWWRRMFLGFRHSSAKDQLKLKGTNLSTWVHNPPWYHKSGIKETIKLQFEMKILRMIQEKETGEQLVLC